jgi:predicted RNA-binding Zn-ribbon protein involved in translation (DUF1610 family)
MGAEMTADFTCTNHGCAEYLRQQKGFPLGVDYAVEMDDGEIRRATMTAMPCSACGEHKEERPKEDRP